MTLRHPFWNLTIACAVIIFTAAAGCKSHQLTQPTPLWASQLPKDTAYYHGIAVADLAIWPIDSARALAKKSALVEIAQQIEVRIESTSLSEDSEINNTTRSEWRRSSRISVNEELENCMLVGEHIDPNQEILKVYYKLSKEEYRKSEKAKKKRALELAYSELNQAQSSKNQGLTQRAFDASVRGLTILLPFANKSLRMFSSEGENIDLWNELEQIFRESLGEELYISTAPEEVWLDVDTQFSERIEAQVLFAGQPAPGVDVEYVYERGDFPVRNYVTTDSQGKIFIEIGKFEPGKESTILKMTVLNDRMVDALPLDHWARMRASSIKPTPQYVRVHLSPIKLVLLVEERHVGRVEQGDRLSIPLKEAFQSVGVAVFDGPESDCIDCWKLKLEARSRDASGPQFQVAKVNVNLVLSDPLGNQILWKDFSEVKGLGLTLENADFEAFTKAGNKLKERYVPEVMRLWHGL